MKSRSSSAPGAPGFILPASSLPCASADFRRVWGGGRGKTLRYSLCRGEVETRTARGAALPASIRAALAANQKSHFFPRGKKKKPTKHRARLRAVSARAPSRREGTGRETLLRSGFGSAGIVFSPPAGMTGAFDPGQRRDGERWCPPPPRKAPTILTIFQLNFIY